MKFPQLDAKDGLVVMALAGLAVTVNGVSMLSPAWAWIVAGCALVAWAIWRLS